MLPTLSFPVGREKVQGLGSGGLVSTGEWWGSGDRLWSLMKSWYNLSVLYLFVLFRPWAEVVASMSAMMRGYSFRYQLQLLLCVLASQSGRLVLLVATGRPIGVND